MTLSDNSFGFLDQNCQLAFRHEFQVIDKTNLHFIF